MKSKKITIISRAVFLAFMLLHSTICFLTSYFGDDYYYAGFVRGEDGYFLSENITHYYETNGRAFIHLLDELLIGFGALPWRIFCIACVGALIVLLAKLASRSYRPDIKERRQDFDCALIAVCTLFSVIELSVLVQSVYWMTGALNYIFPITCTVLVYYLFRRDAEHGSGARSYLLIIPAFIAGLTTEQASVCAVLAIACIIVHQILNRRRMPHPSYFISLGAVLVAAATLFLAPGNVVRTEYYPEFYALSVIDRIKYNARGLLLAVAGEHGIHVLLAIALATLTVLLIKRAYTSRAEKNHPKGKTAARLILYIGAAAVCTAILLVYLFVVNEYAASDADSATLPLAPILTAFLPIVGVLAASLVRYFKFGETDDLFFLWSATSMQIAMSVSPQFGARTVMISAVMLIVPIAQRMLTHRGSCFGILLYAATAVITLYSTPTLGIKGALLALVAFVPIYILMKAVKHREAQPAGPKNALLRITAAYATVVCLLNLFSVAYGFGKNYPVHMANKAQIESYDGEGELVLYRLKYGAYGYTMPYDNAYHEMMFLRLLGFSEETEVVYTDYTEG